MTTARANAMQESEPAADLARLEEEIRGLGSVLVAFSGGVDSGVLLAASVRALGQRAVAITADSPSLPARELEAAQRFARSIGARHLIEKTSEMDLESYRRNDRNRCYWCKHSLFERAAHVARSEAISHVVYGYTADDVGDFRPGHRAAGEHDVRSPLFDSGLGKARIRAVARYLGLGLWDKPAAPCLSSRIPYGTAVTTELLRTIEEVENFLHDCGFAVARARFDGATMRIEVESDEIDRVAADDVRIPLVALATRLGIPLLTIDLEGFRSGKLNDVRSHGSRSS